MTEDQENESISITYWHIFTHNPTLFKVSIKDL